MLRRGGRGPRFISPEVRASNHSLLFSLRGVVRTVVPRRHRSPQRSPKKTLLSAWPKRKNRVPDAYDPPAKRTRSQPVIGDISGQQATSHAWIVHDTTHTQPATPAPIAEAHRSTGGVFVGRQTEEQPFDDDDIHKPQNDTMTPSTISNNHISQSPSPCVSQPATTGSI